MATRYHCRFDFDPSMKDAPAPFEQHPAFIPRVGDCILHDGKRYYVYHVQYSFDLEHIGEPFLIGLHDPKGFLA